VLPTASKAVGPMLFATVTRCCLGRLWPLYAKCHCLPAMNKQVANDGLTSTRVNDMHGPYVEPSRSLDHATSLPDCPTERFMPSMLQRCMPKLMFA
jgi:hypothetical protein